MSNQAVSVVGFVSGLWLLALPGCGNQPVVGPTTVNEDMRRLCSPFLSDDLIRSMLIAFDAGRDEGLAKLDALSGSASECAVKIEDVECLNCFTEIIDHVYTH